MSLPPDRLSYIKHLVRSKHIFPYYNISNIQFHILNTGEHDMRWTDDEFNIIYRILTLANIS